MNVPLPGMPADEPLPPTPAGVHLARRSTGTLCGDCIADIHRRGADRAPHPARVAWELGVGAVTYHLCHCHTRQRLESLT